MLKLELITITTISHLDSFWKRDWGELGNGLLKNWNWARTIGEEGRAWNAMGTRDVWMTWEESIVQAKSWNQPERRYCPCFAYSYSEKKNIMLQWWEYLCFADPPRIDVENNEKINCCYCFVGRKNTCPAFKVWSACFGFALLKWIFFGHKPWPNESILLIIIATEIF